MTAPGPARRDTSPNILSTVRKLLPVLLWGAVILGCFLHRDEITAERIAALASGNRLAAAVLLLGLFALKSVTVVIYVGLLYMASGLLFPLPLAIAVNLAGSAVMVSLPFLMGRRLGTGAVSRMAEEHPKLALLRDAPRQNALFFSFFVRIVGCLPGDLVSMYLGACGLPYGKYLAGSLLGLLSAVLSFAVMGKNIYDVTSPAFLIAAGVEVGLMVLSLLLYPHWRRNRTS